jgi:hypothetical protein
MTLRPSSLSADPLLYTVGLSSRPDMEPYAAATALSAACAAASSTEQHCRYRVVAESTLRGRTASRGMRGVDPSQT